MQRAAAEAEGFPSQFAGRLHGESYNELRRDAKQALKDFGFTTPQPRDERGQFKSFNDELRAAAGYSVAADEQPPEGDIGVGRGGAAIPRQPQPPSMNDLIRAATGIRTSGMYDLAEQIATLWRERA